MQSGSRGLWQVLRCWLQQLAERQPWIRWHIVLIGNLPTGELVSSSLPGVDLVSLYSMLCFCCCIHPREASSLLQVLVPYGDQPLMLRIGMHSGCVTSGVVGKMRKRYCLFGSTVNVASRMEHTARHGTIQVSAATWLQLAHLPGICWEKREVNVKGKGPMVTYTVTSYDRALLGLSYL
jgi:hypothetical protein